MTDHNTLMKSRFRGYLPVIIDIETGGFNAKTDAILEIAAVFVDFDENNRLMPTSSQFYHIKPFEGANLEIASLEFTGIDPEHPFRFAIDEKEALKKIVKAVQEKIKASGCIRAVLVGHNPAFDISFLQAAIKRQHIKRDPFHPFTTFDTATLAACAYGQTVLAKAVEKAGFTFDANEAHSALYDAERTADLFCEIINRWKSMGGWCD